MNKPVTQSEEFLAFDLKGRPTLLSRSGSFIDRAQVEQTQKQAPAFQTTNKLQAQAQSTPTAVRYQGGFDQFRNRLLGKTKVA